MLIIGTNNADILNGTTEGMHQTSNSRDGG